MSYYAPGAQRAAGETGAQTLLREIKEALTVDLGPASPPPAGTWEVPPRATPAACWCIGSHWASHYAGTRRPAAEIEEVAGRPAPAAGVGGGPTAF